MTDDEHEIDFEVLGPLRVVRDGRELPFPRGRLRTLLATFLLHRGEAVSPQYLVRAVWEDRTPEHPVPALATLMTRLRKHLAGIAPDVAHGVRNRPGGYLFAPAGDRLDAVAFQAAVDRARWAGAAGRLEHAERCLADGLRLWRGPSLPEIDSRLLRAGPITRLEEDHLLGVERRQSLCVLLGSEIEQIGELRTLVAEHPGRERLAYHLALALHRAGRSAEALVVLHRAAAYLREEFGVDRGGDLSRLHLGIVEQDERLTAPGPATIAWLPGTGWLDRAEAGAPRPLRQPVRG